MRRRGLHSLTVQERILKAHPQGGLFLFPCTTTHLAFARTHRACRPPVVRPSDLMKLTNKQKAAALATLRRLLKGPNWDALNKRRGALIDREAANALTPDSRRELEALQALEVSAG